MGSLPGCTVDALGPSLLDLHGCYGFKDVARDQSSRRTHRDLLAQQLGRKGQRGGRAGG
jgi:hypothetical protein